MKRFYAEEYDLASGLYSSLFYLEVGNYFSYAHCDLNYIGKEIPSLWMKDNWDAIVYRVDRFLSRKRVEVTNLVHSRQFVLNKNLCVVSLKEK